jgi:hypothetical protein
MDLNHFVRLKRYMSSSIFKELVPSPPLGLGCFVVEDIGVEPMTPCVQGRCSSQLS